jgi:hypothetical protein
MPTHEEEERFQRDWKRLKRWQKRAFIAAVQEFAHDLDSGELRPSLRVMPMADHPGIWEMTWEGHDGRATFSYGPETIPGKRHVIWRRVGGHKIFQEP